MFHRPILNAHRIALLATLALPIAFAANAQEATVLDRIAVESESDDILVQDGYVPKSGRIGTKTDSPLVEVPQTISTVTERQLDDQNPRTLNEAINYTPGARPGAYGFDPRFDAFFIRGFPATYNGIFRDGLRQFNSPTGLFRNEIYGLEGISILKGPASALYGAMSGGGLVDLMTKRPTDHVFREVEVQYGSHDRYQTNFDFSGPANEDQTLFYRLTGVLRDSGTEIDGFPDDRIYIAPALTWAPTDDTKLTILGEYMDSTVGGTAAYYNINNTVTDLYEGDPRYNDFDQQQYRIGYEFEHRFNETFKFRHSARYSHVDNTLEYGYIAGMAGDPGYNCATFLPTGPLPGLQRCAGINAEKVGAFVTDTQLQADFYTGPVSHTMLFGVDTSYATYTQHEGFGYLPGAGAAPSLSTLATDQEIFDTGIYIQDQLEYENWLLTLGARYNWLSAETASYGVGSEQEDEAFSGRVGLGYRTAFGLVPYISYSTSFAPNVGTVVSGDPARTTKGEQWEAGVKYEIPGRNAVITASVFDIKQEDAVVFEVIGGINQQVHLDLRSRGFEIEGAASLDNGINLIASYAYIDTTILGGAPGLAGNKLSSIPHHTFSIWGDYTIHSGAAAGLGFGAGLRYTGKSFGNDENTFKNDDRFFLDAAVHYDFGERNPQLEGLRLQVNAFNLLDERKQTCTSGYCYRDEGMNVIGSLRYRF